MAIRRDTSAARRHDPPGRIIVFGGVAIYSPRDGVAHRVPCRELAERLMRRGLISRENLAAVAHLLPVGRVQ